MVVHCICIACQVSHRLMYLHLNTCFLMGTYGGHVELK